MVHRKITSCEVDADEIDDVEEDDEDAASSSSPSSWLNEDLVLACTEEAGIVAEGSLKIFKDFPSGKAASLYLHAASSSSRK